MPPWFGWPDGREVELRLSVPGDHMLLNAVAALAAGVELGVAPQALADGLAGYTGVRRRFELKGSAAGITVYDDYAHHPTEVAAQITAARGVLGELSTSGAGRLVVVFQPHLYSRTATFADAFGVALGGRGSGRACSTSTARGRIRSRESAGS